ncbi:solute carrier family 11 member 1 [Homo sapiens]|uniref:Solute carrier family 11 member 1 n=1 Tax=Homo sapiens TaxID=9606 RepID=A0A0A0MTL3_HUMAN|nr:solute carrier family 11 member 1 [Homo sapiens]KAI4038092.1 solute carrier family 11 member 1 [Homo sapiens]
MTGHLQPAEAMGLHGAWLPHEHCFPGPRKHRVRSSGWRRGGIQTSLGAALGHRVGLALPATGCTSGRGDRQGLGRGLPSLLP